MHLCSRVAALHHRAHLPTMLSTQAPSPELVFCTCKSPPAGVGGLDIAVRMRDAGYDPDEVTPDADNWKYAPLF
jgi:hypothetical protein